MNNATGSNLAEVRVFRTPSCELVAVTKSLCCAAREGLRDSIEQG